MKSILHLCSLTVISSLALIDSSQAGDTFYNYGKNTPYTPPSAMTCYHAGFEFGIYGAGFFPGDDTALESATGGGISLGYFFDENFGVDFGAAFYSTDSEVQNYTLDAVYRFPFQDACIAPYVLGGAGVHTNGENAMLFRVGAGIDAKLNNTMSLFTDGIYNVLGDDVENYSTIRAGIRFRF